VILVQTKLGGRHHKEKNKKKIGGDAKRRAQIVQRVEKKVLGRLRKALAKLDE